MLCDDIIWKFSPFIWILNHNIEEQTHEGVHIGVCDNMTNAWNVNEERKKTPKWKFKVKATTQTHIQTQGCVRIVIS
jgi:hypothetical protein